MAEQSRSGQLIARAIKQALRNCASVLSHAKGCRKCISCGCRGLGWDQVAALRWVFRKRSTQSGPPSARQSALLSLTRNITLIIPHLSLCRRDQGHSDLCWGSSSSTTSPEAYFSGQEYTIKANAPFSDWR